METEYFEHPSGYFGVYDSKGIEVGQGGDKILADFRELIAEKRRLNLREQIHVIWYCVRAADLRFENSQAKFIEELASEGIPILLVITQVPMRNGRIKPEVVELADSVTERRIPLSPENRVLFTMAMRDDFDGIEAHGLRELLEVPRWLDHRVPRTAPGFSV